MPGSIRVNQFVRTSQIGDSFLEESKDIPFAVRESIRKLKIIISLDHSTRIFLRVYHFTMRFRKSAEGSGRAARERSLENLSMAVYWNKCNSGSVIR